MSFKYIKQQYQVPAKRGGRIKFKGQLGTIIGSWMQYLKIRLDGKKRSGIYHPTWEIEYLEGE